MQGHPPASTAPLFRLPLEILDLIQQCLDPISLLSLAFVNNYCQQLARSLQFWTADLDSFSGKRNLCMKLALEAKVRSDAAGHLTSVPSLGACIRRVNVEKIAFDAMTGRYGIIHDPIEAEKEDCRKRTHMRGPVCLSNYLPLILRIFTYSYTLTDWKSLAWDGLAISKHCWRQLSLTNIVHLDLRGVPVDSFFQVVQEGRWPPCGLSSIGRI